MITYVLTISKTFPAYHPKAGQETNFPDKILQLQKIHTIRNNYELWKKRFDKINQGKAVLSVRTWSGKPYQSKQEEIFLFDSSFAIGIQKIEYSLLGCFLIDNQETDLLTRILAKNDGLSLSDFHQWFKFRLYDTNTPRAIIHFTPFRY